MDDRSRLYWRTYDADGRFCPSEITSPGAAKDML